MEHDVLANAMVVVILQYRNVSNQYRNVSNQHLKLTQCYIPIISQYFKKPTSPGYKCQVTSLGPLRLSVNFLDPHIPHM